RAVTCLVHLSLSFSLSTVLYRRRYRKSFFSFPSLFLCLFLFCLPLF
ncbi:hypothetical protein CSUI_007514, partial [Cystoisospora suis]